MPELPASAPGPIPAPPPPAEQVPWSQVSFAPWPDGAGDEAIDLGVSAKPGAHTTLLLWSRQVDAEASSTCVHIASRLETPLAVQNESQWRLEIHPRFQRLQLHRLRLLRQGAVVDQLQRERMRLLQRETQLERHVISGSWTLLAVLDDVRPGDVIESAYTVFNHHPINAGQCEVFFPIPNRHVIGRYRLRLLSDADRPQLRFKASPGFPSPTETTLANGRIERCWAGSQLDPGTPEPNIPNSALAYGWIQVSDFPDWQSLSRRIAAAWEAQRGGAGPNALPDFPPPAAVDAPAVAALVRRIQDEFRYLSIDLETGSWIPAPPDLVTRQRRGDCKDLVWLAACVLRSWGVSARPVLVGTGVRGAAATLLPMTSLFNHAALEVDLGGRRRWFDLTLRHQGGTFETVPVPPYECGLPVDPDGADLARQPGARAPSIYSVRETFHIDARRGRPSFIEVRVRAEGHQADALRGAFTVKAAEDFADERLKNAQQRYPQAKRVGRLQWRDDRTQNVCEVAESFEAVLPIAAGDRGSRSIYEVPGSQPARFFAVPEDKPRSYPWNMPFPLELRHVQTFCSPAMGPADPKRRRWSGEGYTITLEDARRPWEWSKTSRFRVDAPAIPAAALADYSAKLKDYIRAASWRLLLPPDAAAPKLPDGWGDLPSAALGRTAYVGDDDPADFPEAKLGEELRPASRWRRWRIPPLGFPRNLFLILWLILLFGALTRSCNPTQ